MRLEKRNGEPIEIDFTLRGYSYGRKKAAARRLGAYVAGILPECDLTNRKAGDIAEIMETIGSRFGLLQEYKAAGII